MNMLTKCYKCGFDDTHQITDEIKDEDGYPMAYTLHCRKCENVWTVALREAGRRYEDSN